MSRRLCQICQNVVGDVVAGVAHAVKFRMVARCPALAQLVLCWAIGGSKMPNIIEIVEVITVTTIATGETRVYHVCRGDWTGLRVYLAESPHWYTVDLFERALRSVADVVRVRRELL